MSAIVVPLRAGLVGQILLHPDFGPAGLSVLLGAADSFQRVDFGGLDRVLPAMQRAFAELDARHPAISPLHYAERQLDRMGLGGNGPQALPELMAERVLFPLSVELRREAPDLYRGRAGVAAEQLGLVPPPNPMTTREGSIRDRLKNPPLFFFLTPLFGKDLWAMVAGDYEGRGAHFRIWGDWLMLEGNVLRAQKAFERSGDFFVRAAIAYIRSKILEREDIFPPEHVDNFLDVVRDYFLSAQFVYGQALAAEKDRGIETLIKDLDAAEGDLDRQRALAPRILEGARILIGDGKGTRE